MYDLNFFQLKLNFKYQTLMLRKHGLPNEKIFKTMIVHNVNHKSKMLSQLLTVTNEALYLSKESNIIKCIRKINLRNIICIRTVFQEILIHLKNECDLYLKTNEPGGLLYIVASLYNDKTGTKLIQSFNEELSIAELFLTKKKFKKMNAKDMEERNQRIVEEILFNQSKDKKSDINKTFKIKSDSQKQISGDDFNYIKVLGRGAFGKVMLATKISTGELCAIKILDKENLVRKNMVEKIKAEKKILECSKHPFVLKLKCKYETKYKIYIVTDFYAGGELFFHLREKKYFKEKEAKLIISEVVLALEYLHKNRVIYRDLKPENVVLDNEGHICLVDVGHSKIFDEDEEMETGTYIETPCYLAPEMVKRNIYNESIDWWSLGIFIYELLVGYTPFFAHNTMEMINKILKKEVSFPDHISKNAKTLISRLLEKDSKNRMGSGEGGVRQIKNHLFFEEINWENVLNKKVKPKYKPKKSNGKFDTRNFDNNFTDEPVVDTPIRRNTTKFNINLDFSYK